MIRLRYATFDPLQGVPQVDASLRTVPQSLNEVGHYLVQCQGHIQPGWLQALKAAGVLVLDYIPDDTLLVRATARQAAALPGNLRFVRWTGVMHPAYKIDPRVMTPQAKPQQVVLRAQTFSPGERSSLARRLRQYGAAVVAEEGRTVDVNGSQPLAVQLARTVEVRWVQARPVVQLHNDRSAQIMGASGFAGARSHRLYGKGQIVGICDTGLDTGDVNSINEDFKGRVTGIALGRPNDWADLVGHGTHVAGSVLGSGVNSGGVPGSHDYDKSFAGIAPEASVIMQGLDEDPNLGLVGIPANLYDLFVDPYNLGARVHTNSWGAPDMGWYNQMAADADRFIYDHDDMVVLFSAGNEGVDNDWDGVVDLRSMGDPAAAKNIITVGASEGYRPPSEGWQGYAQDTWYVFGYVFGPWFFSSFPQPPLSTDYTSDNIEGMCAFSSRGPCIDGRIKPDIVAPGSNIVSVWSAPAAQAGGNGWGEFSGPYNANSAISKYIYMGGTSMATPLTAGAATLVREYYVTKQNWQPTAALVKATLINGAHDMNPGQYGLGRFREMGARPNPVEGYGRVDLARALYPSQPRKVNWIDRPSGLQTGQALTLRYTVNSPNETLSATLVWTDPPGSPVSFRALVNDLDLTITDPMGNTFNGNGGAMPDRVNNVENIDLRYPQTGTYTITISGANVPFGPQSYALVLSGDGGPAGGRFPDISGPVVKITQPTTGSPVKGTTDVKVSALDDRGIDRVYLQLDNSVLLGTRYAPPYTFSWKTLGFAAGQHTLSAVAVDTSRNVSTDTITINIQP